MEGQAAKGTREQTARVKWRAGDGNAVVNEDQVMTTKGGKQRGEGAGGHWQCGGE